MSTLSSQKSVALISYHTCPLASEEGKETGGMNVYVLELAKALGSIGWQVDIYTRKQDPSNAAKVCITPSVTLYHVEAGPAANLTKLEMRDHIGTFTDNVWQIWQQEQKKYRVVHAHYYLSGLIAQQLQLRSQTQSIQLPLVITYHTMALLKNLVARSDSEREDSVRLEAEFQLAQHAQAIITPSEVESDYVATLLGAQPDRVHVVPPGVNLSIFHPIDRLLAKQTIGVDPNTNLLLFAGRIEPLKGLDSLLYAIKILKQRQPTVPLCLSIVGGDISQPNEAWSDELKRINELKHLLGLHTEVRFVGQQPQTKLPYYYNAAEVVVMPSHYESFGMVAAEAMACGAPVLMTNVMGISERIDETHRQLITTAQHPLLLADQIEAILTNHSARQSLSESLRQSVSDLDWQQVVRRIETVYEQCQSH